MNDEKYVFIQDVREKKNIARSAKHVRTHNGAGGSVKFPSDYLSNKERKAMNGECKSYRLNEPLTWEDFGELPSDLKRDYILALRKKFNVPDAEIAKMFDIRPRTLCDYFKRHAELNLSKGKGSGNYVATWDKDGWIKWLDKKIDIHSVIEESDIPSTTLDNNGATGHVDALLADPDNIPINVTNVANINFISPENDLAIVPPADEYTKAYISYDLLPRYMSVPTKGTMSFDGRIESILPTIAMMLNNKNVHIDISWEVEEDV